MWCLVKFLVASIQVIWLWNVLMGAFFENKHWKKMSFSGVKHCVGNLLEILTQYHQSISKINILKWNKQNGRYWLKGAEIEIFCDVYISRRLCDISM